MEQSASVGAVLAELKAIRKRRFGMTKDTLAASPLIVGFLGNGDAEVAHSVFIQSALRHDWQQEIEAALYSLGIECEKETHLDRLEAFATEWFMDQRQARRYSDKGLEQIAQLITTNWAVFSTPTIQLAYSYVEALGQLRIDVVARHLLATAMKQPKFTVVEYGTTTELIYPIAVSEDDQHRTLRTTLYCDWNPGQPFELTTIWRGELWPMFEQTFVEAVTSNQSHSFHSAGNKSRIIMYGSCHRGWLFR